MREVSLLAAAAHFGAASITRFLLANCAAIGQDELIEALAGPSLEILRLVLDRAPA
jgi:hypothetical protein